MRQIFLHCRFFSSLRFALAIFLFATTVPFAAAMSLPLEGKDVITGKARSVGAKNKKGLAVVFLSAECPCSNSHVAELAKLAADYPSFQFVAVNANANESDAEVKTYFEKAALPFPVLRDSGAKIADALKAAKTPHAFLLSPGGKVLYNGGVSNRDRKSVV